MPKNKDLAMAANDIAENDDDVVTADELVDGPEDNINPKPVQRCPKCTADIVDGECVNCHFKP